MDINTAITLLSSVVPWVSAALIGVLFGATELITRYKDKPLAFATSKPGIAYVAVNAAAAALAYWLMLVFEATFGATDPTKITILQVAAAGLGAMAFFRSGFFNVRMGDSDVPIGPNLILESILRTIDRHVDRNQAGPRSQRASQLMADVSFDRAMFALPDLCFSLMQNVSEAEKTEIGEAANRLKETTEMSNDAKSINLGLALMNVVGSDVLENAIKALNNTITGPPTLTVELLAAAAAADPSLILSSLAEVCDSLRRTTDNEFDKAQISKITALSIAQDNKALLLVRVLIKHYGEGVVAPALASLNKPASLEIAAPQQTVASAIPAPG